MNQLATTRRSHRSRMALAGALAALAVGCALLPVAASAATTDEDADSYSPSVWVQTSDTRPAPTTPSLTSGVEQPDVDSPQLPIGLSLLGLGALALLAGLALMRGRPSDEPRAALAGRGWHGTARLPTEADVRP